MKKINTNELFFEKGYSNVIILDYLGKNEIMKYYIASDLFVLAIREDIWGLVIVEALAAGIPLISTDKCVAALELKNQGADISIVKHDNPKEIRYQILRILDNSFSYDMEKNINIAKKYTLENVVLSHKKAFDEVIGE